MRQLLRDRRSSFEDLVADRHDEELPVLDESRVRLRCFHTGRRRTTSNSIEQGALGVAQAARGANARRALSQFDPERCDRFATYAEHWIRAHMLNYVMRSWSLVGGGSGKSWTAPLRRSCRSFAKLSQGRVLGAGSFKLYTYRGEPVEIEFSRFLHRDVTVPIRQSLFEDFASCVGELARLIADG
jgi:hypothetical protein